MLRTALVLLFAVAVSAAQNSQLTDLFSMFKIVILMPKALGGELTEEQMQKDIDSFSAGTVSRWARRQYSPSK